MAFIDDHVHPFNLGKNRAVLDDVLVRSQKHLEIRVSDLCLLDYLSHLRYSLVDHLDYIRSPFLKFKRPVR